MWESGQAKHSGQTGEDGIMGVTGTPAESERHVVPQAGIPATLESLTLGRIPPTRGQVMDRLRDFLDLVTEQGQATGNFLGLLHVLIGRKIALEDGTEVSRGLTWRDVAALFKKLRWDPEAVRELGVDPESLPPRDRQRYWYQAIAQAKVDSEEAIEGGDRLAEVLKEAGYIIGPAPRR